MTVFESKGGRKPRTEIDPVPVPSSILMMTSPALPPPSSSSVSSSTSESQTERLIQTDLLEKISRLRTNNPLVVEGEDELRDLRDVTFLVGPEKKIFKANSTLLSLKSPFFKAMCFGPLRKPGEPKEMPDVDPETFDKVMDFVFDPGNFDISCLEEAWNVRHAAGQYLISDLVETCDEFVQKRLTHKNCLSVLEQATAFRAAEEFKKKIFRYTDRGSGLNLF